jgi:hypothetical protein
MKPLCAKLCPLNLFLMSLMSSCAFAMTEFNDLEVRY